MTALLPILICALATNAMDIQVRPDRRTPQTDQTVQVQRGARLLIENFAGEVIVRSWDRDSLRVQARHASRVRVNVRTVATGVRVSSSSERGPHGSVDYEISAPTWMPVKIEGQFNFATIEGLRAEVSVDTNRGDIVIRGGNGVTAKSIEGDITIENATGKINVSSVNKGVTINGASGEVTAETVNGPIAMAGMQASTVEASSINGSLSYEGTVANAGRYQFTSHNGSITVAVPESSNATFSVRTYNGSFNSNLPVKGDREIREVQHGRRAIFTLGNGSAEFELESFAGGIRLRKPGTSGATPKTKEKDEH